VIRLEPLATQGADAIDALLDAAFGADRRGRTAYAIRRGMAWLTGLSYAAIDAASGDMAGLLQSWPVALNSTDSTQQAPLVMVGPVAVLPARQGEGIGRALMDRLVADADRLGGDPLVMIGDPEYYGRFWGFSAAETGPRDVPGPVERARLLARAAGGKDQPLPVAGMLGPRRMMVQAQP
jgi:predicted N-acetyltransferase YhbS